MRYQCDVCGFEPTGRPCEACGNNNFEKFTPIHDDTITDDGGPGDGGGPGGSNRVVVFALVLLMAIGGCIGCGYIFGLITPRPEPTVIVDTNGLTQTAETRKTATAEAKATATAERKTMLTAQALAGASASKKQTATAEAKTATAEAHATATAERRITLTAQALAEASNSQKQTATAEAKIATAEAHATATEERKTTLTAQALAEASNSQKQTATAEAKTATAEAKATTTARTKATATAEARLAANKTATVQARRADETAIEDVVRRYSEEIKIDNVTHLNSSTLSQVLVDPVLEKQKRSACWLENEKKYYTYSNRDFTIDTVTLNSDWQATVLARIQENRVLRNKDGSVNENQGYDDYRAIYQLEKKGNNKWYIYCFQALEDGEAARCEVKLEGANPCR